MKRLTLVRRWGPSRVRDVSSSSSYVVLSSLKGFQEFLFYQEKDPEPVDVDPNSDSDTTSVRFSLVSIRLTS